MSLTTTQPVSVPPLGIFSADGAASFQVLLQDTDRVFYRRERQATSDQLAVLVVLPAVEHPARAILDRLAHEYELRDELDRAWAVRPLQLIREAGRTMLVLDDPGGESLDGYLGRPMDVDQFLRLAIGLASALHGLHKRGLIHKDIKPTNILYSSVSGRVWLCLLYTSPSPRD